jgi:hypothetical protein
LPATGPTADDAGSSCPAAAGDEGALDALVASAASAASAPDGSAASDPQAALRALLDAELDGLRKESAAANAKRLPPSIAHHLAAFASGAPQSPGSPGSAFGGGGGGGGAATLAAFCTADAEAVVVDDADAVKGPYVVSALPVVRLCDVLVAKDVPLLGLLDSDDGGDDAAIL